MSFTPSPPHFQHFQQRKLDSFSIKLLVGVTVICATPIMLNLAGVDFASVAKPFHLHEFASSNVLKATLIDNMFYALAGGLTHGLLEWSAVIAALLTTVLAFSHFAINKDVTTPIIGVALLCSGAMDAFHTLAATRLIEAVAPNTDLIPFTWALSRGFNAGILIVGVLICLRFRITRTRVRLYQIGGISLLFAAISYFLIIYAANSAELPQTQFSDAMVTRPYDVLPLLLFTFAIPFFWKLYRASPNLLTTALLIALIPEIVLEAHMAFGSQALFDNHFNIAHFLKIVAYMVPFIGLVGEYIDTYRVQEKISRQFADGQQRLQAIMDTAIDGILTIDEQGIIQDCNPAASRIFQYQTEEMTGLDITVLMPKFFDGDQEGYLLNQSDGVNSLSQGIRDIEGKRKDGTVFPIDMAMGEMNLRGKTLFSGTVRDITERKQADQKLAEGKQRLQAVMYTAVDGIIMIDDKGIIQDCNPAASRIFGYQSEELVGQNVKMLMPSPYNEEHDGYLDHYHQTGVQNIIGSGGRELIGKRKDGSTFPMDLSIGEMKLDDQTLFSGLVRDITERKQAEEALKATNEELERFAYIASHDLKAPLRVIDNASQWLEEDLAEHLTGDNRDNMNLMRGRVKRMEKLLDDLLEYSRVGRTTDPRYQERMNGATLIDEIVELLDPPEEFTIQISPSFASIHVPKMPLQQILLNLINNALKHHDKTEGTIQVSVEDLKEDYRFTVTDDGPGIPSAFHEQVFAMFQTLKPRDQVEGSGMGLAMVKKHVDLAGGTVHLESVEGQGSTFTIFWPKQHTMEGQPV